MGIFSRLLGLHAFEPPTQKQIKYAKSLGIPLAEGLSKQEVSEAFSSFQHRNPIEMERRRKIKSKIREKKLGGELVRAEAYWGNLVDQSALIGTVFSKNKKLVAEVVMVDETDVNEFTNSAKLRVRFATPRKVKSGYCKGMIDWEGRSFFVELKDIVWHKVVELNFPGVVDKPGWYEKQLSRVEREARRLS